MSEIWKRGELISEPKSTKKKITRYKQNQKNKFIKIKKYQKWGAKKTKRISKKQPKTKSIKSVEQVPVPFRKSQPTRAARNQKTREMESVSKMKLSSGFQLEETNHLRTREKRQLNERESVNSLSKNRHFLSGISKSTCTKKSISGMNQSPTSLNFSQGEVRQIAQSSLNWPQNAFELNKDKLEQLLKTIPARHLSPGNIRNLWVDPGTLSIYQKLTGIDNSSEGGHLIPLETVCNHPEYGWRGWRNHVNQHSLEALKVGAQLDQEQMQDLGEKFQISNLPLLVKNFNLKLKRKLRNKGKNKQNGCGCSKSKCLRLHCKCFRNGKMCTDNCRCTCCFNNQEHSQVVEKIRTETKKICSKAFEEPVISMEIDGETRVFSKGCSCSKFKCCKKYCGCRQKGFACNPLCKCVGCDNMKIHMEPEQANKLYRKSVIFRRKKNKSVKLSNFVGGG